VPVSFLCEREGANIPKGQIGFISGIVLPLFISISAKLPNLDEILDSIRSNREHWEQVTKLGN
jgi:hypothetical protein